MEKNIKCSEASQRHYDSDLDFIYFSLQDSDREAAWESVYVDLLRVEERIV